MSKIYVASLNKAKLDAVNEVLNEYEIVGMSVDSNVSKQPLTDQETIKGALNRALALPQDGIRIGLEAGVQQVNDLLFLVNWGVLIDKFDNIYYAGGTRIPLPEFVKKGILEDKLELSEIMEEYTQIENIRSNQGAIGIFTNSLVSRKDIFTHIIKLLYGQYLRRK